MAPSICDVALTLTQPWAGLVASAVKRIENRTWRPPVAMIGKRFAIHASREIDEDVVSELLLFGLEEQPSWRTTSGIVGVATLDDFVRSEHGVLELIRRGRLPEGQEKFWIGPVAFVLTDIVLFDDPVPCKGQRSFWTMPPDIRSKVVDRLVSHG